MRRSAWFLVVLLPVCTSDIDVSTLRRHEFLFPSARTYACIWQRSGGFGDELEQYLLDWVTKYDLIECTPEPDVIKAVSWDTVVYGARSCTAVDSYNYDTDESDYEMAELRDWISDNWSGYDWGRQFSDAEAAFEDCFVHVTEPVEVGFAVTAETLALQGYTEGNPSRSRLPGPWDIDSDWIMNPASPVYRSYWEDHNAAEEAANNGDGYFMDVQHWPRPGFDLAKVREFPSEESYLEALSELTVLIRDGLHARFPAKQLGINNYDALEADSDPPRMTFEDDVDFIWREGSIRYTKAAELFEKEIAAVHRVGLSGKPVLMRHVSDFSLDPSRDRMAGLAAYYLAMNDNVYFFTSSSSLSSDARLFVWMPALEVDIGRPEGEFYEFAAGTDPSSDATYRVFGRNFTGALVLFKPRPDWRSPTLYDGTTATTHALDGIYRPLSESGELGAPVTTVTLRNYEGAILVRAE